ncbi:MAG: hypothetical protein AAB214_12990, partial [Fibrobacterota bacterium]
MNTCILISSQDVTPDDKAAIQAMFNSIRNDLQFVVLEHLPKERATRNELAGVTSRLLRMRRGMHALLLRHQALRTAAQRYQDRYWHDRMFELRGPVVT